MTVGTKLWGQACSLHVTPALPSLHSLLLGLRSNLGSLGPWCFLTVGETIALMPVSGALAPTCEPL